MSLTASLTISRLGVPFDAWEHASPLLRAMGRGEAPAGFPLFDWRLPSHGDSPFIDRAMLADELARSNAALGNPLTDATVQSIRSDGLFVVTGQQPGLLTGPMYSVLKAITAIRMADELSRSFNRPVLAAYWIAGEDHDIEEVNHAQIGSQVMRCQHEEQGPGPRPPVGRLSLEPWREELWAFVERSLPAGEARDELLAQLREANYENYTTLFASLMSWLIGRGRLICIDPMQMRRAMAGPLALLAERAAAVNQAFEEGAAAMEAAGFEPQLDRVNCFEFDDQGRRVHVDLAPELAKRIRANPQAFSPGAALRPVIQDAMLPVVCTIGGPGELQYLWQIDGIYKTIGVHRSELWPRASATLIDHRTVERGRRFGLLGARLLEAPALLAQFDPSQFAARDEQLEAIAAARDQLLRQIMQLDNAAQDKLVEKAVDSIGHQVGKLLDRISNERLSRQGIGKGELKQLAEALCPHGEPAERVVSMLDAVGRFGRSLMDRLEAELDPRRLEHQIITVGPAAGPEQGERL